MRMAALLHEGMAEKSQKYLGTVQEVIVDGPSGTNAELMSGRTMDNKLVNFSGSVRVGESINVRITKAQTFYLAGEAI